MCIFLFLYFPQKSYKKTLFLKAIEKHQNNQNPQENIKEIEHIISQTFYYKDQGCTSSAFLSEDGRYILKLFKLNGKLSKKEVIDRLKGYQLANDFHKEATGIIFLHLNKSTYLKRKINLIDNIGISNNSKFGIRRILDLDNYIFVIQHRADKLGSLLYNSLKIGKLKEAREYLKSIFNLYEEEIKKGVFDSDSKFLFNTGFIKNMPIRFDVGSLKKLEQGLQPNQVYIFRKNALQHTIKWIQKKEFEDYSEIIQDVVVWLSTLPRKS